MCGSRVAESTVIDRGSWGVGFQDFFSCVVGGSCVGKAGLRVRLELAKEYLRAVANTGGCIRCGVVVASGGCRSACVMGFRDAGVEVQDAGGAGVRSGEVNSTGLAGRGVGDDGIGRSHDRREDDRRVVNDGLSSSTQLWRASEAVEFDQVVGSVPIVEVGGKNCERNRVWRRERKERKAARRALGCDWRKRGSGSVEVGACGVPGFGRGNVVQSVELRNTVEEKWKARNALERKRCELETESVERKLALLRAENLGDVIKRERTKLLAVTERNMASIERTHAELVGAGNVPGGFRGSACTLVDGSTCDVPVASANGSLSISPSSSASQAEFRAVQKENLDLMHKVQQMEKAFTKLGYTFEDADAVDKCTFTDDTAGNDLLDRLYPDGVGIHMVQRGDKRKMKIGGQDY